MNVFTLRLLGADEPIYEGDCESLVVPTSEGEYGVQAHHRNLIAAVVPGVLRFRAPGQTEHQQVVISEGLLKVENNEALVLVGTTERPEESDLARARRAADAAREEMLQNRSIQDYRAAQAHRARALARMRVKGER